MADFTWKLLPIWALFFSGIERAILQSVGPVPIFEWSQLEYKYASLEDKKKDIESKNFIPNKPALIDVDVAFPDDDAKRTFFVTSPRFQEGIPVSLGRITKEKFQGNPVIDPYPSWSWHQNPKNCSRERLVSVFRVQVDTCGRLWVLDTGSYNGDLICAPQILSFDLNTNRVVHKYEIPKSLLQSNSLFVTPIVDVSDGCMNTFVYAADNQANSLIVYDARRNESWKITDKTMYPDPDFGTFTILGESFDLMDGILGMALDAYRDPRKLYYHALTSNTEHVVKVSDIRNRDKFAKNPNSSPQIFYTYRGRRKSQSPAEAIDRQGILYFGDVNEVTLNCWDTATEYGPLNIKTLSRNKTIMQFTSGMKVIDCGKTKQDLYFVTNRYQKVALGIVNTKEINFRVLKLEINDWTKMKCM